MIIYIIILHMGASVAGFKIWPQPVQPWGTQCYQHRVFLAVLKKWRPLWDHISFLLIPLCGWKFQFHVLSDEGWVLHWYSHCLEAWLADIIEDEGWLDQRRKLLRQRAGLSERDNRKVWCSMERGWGAHVYRFFPFAFSILEFQIMSIWTVIVADASLSFKWSQKPRGISTMVLMHTVLSTTCWVTLPKIDRLNISYCMLFAWAWYNNAIQQSWWHQMAPGTTVGVCQSD